MKINHYNFLLKMSKNMKNAHWSFPKCLVLSSYRSQTHSCSVYYHRKLKQTANIHIWHLNLKPVNFWFSVLKCITVCSQFQTLQWQHEVKVNEGEKQTLIKFSPGGKNLGMLSVVTVDREVWYGVSECMWNLQHSARKSKQWKKNHVRFWSRSGNILNGDFKMPLN